MITEEFAAALVKAGSPSPWRVDSRFGTDVVDANGRMVADLDIDPGRRPVDDLALALMIVVAVNVCAGHEAKVVK